MARSDSRRCQACFVAFRLSLFYRISARFSRWQNYLLLGLFLIYRRHFRTFLFLESIKKLRAKVKINPRLGSNVSLILLT